MQQSEQSLIQQIQQSFSFNLLKQDQIANENFRIRNISFEMIDYHSDMFQQCEKNQLYAENFEWDQKKSYSKFRENISYQLSYDLQSPENLSNVFGSQSVSLNSMQSHQISPILSPLSSSQKIEQENSPVNVNHPQNKNKSKRNKRKKNFQIPQNQKIRRQTSKYVNYQKYFIKSISKILDRDYRIKDGSYFVQQYKNSNKFILIQSQLKYQDKIINDWIYYLKRQVIKKLSKKNSSKTKLLKLINDQNDDKDETKSAKQILRNQIIHFLNDSKFLQYLVESRLFHPKDDLDGTTKQQRYENFKQYLILNRDHLIQFNQISKRI